MAAQRDATRAELMGLVDAAADLAISEPASFTSLVKQAQAALAA